MNLFTHEKSNLNHWGQFYPSIINKTLKTINKLKPSKLQLHLENHRYIVRTTESTSERQQAFRLRSEVFSEDFNLGGNFPDYDTDLYDSKAHILVVIEKKSQRIIGTYRLIEGLRSKDFYSSSEFQIKKFLAMETGKKLELSRACIHPQHRNGAVILMLWRGIYSALNQLNADIMFGCSSISNIKKNHLVKIMGYLQENKHTIDNKWDVTPKSKFNCNQSLLSHLYEINQPFSIADQVPPLLRAYLKIGAKVLSIPAYDKNFQCFDFFTILKVKEMNQATKRKLAA